MEKIKKIIKKLLTKEVILYVVFGALTTAVNLGTFYILNSLLNWNKNLSNFIAIVLAVLFAYITNKDLVFHSEAKTLKAKWIEFVKFMTGRAFTMAIEFFGGLVLFQTPIPEMIIKIAVTVIVVILNFFISKFFAFKRKK
jgi:putative flippase GtrA